MGVTSTSTAAARAMGARAGAAWQDSGVPSANPFEGKQPELAKAWRTAYFNASRVRGR